MPPPTPGSPSPRKRRRKRDDPQNCVTNSEEYDSDEASPSSYAEVERFQGKVVYNLDGKAYIIDSESELPLQLNDSSIKDVSQSNNPKIHSFRVISSRDATMSQAASTTPTRITGSPTSDSSPPSQHQQQQQQGESGDESREAASHANHRQKPILMCFICKLSFGNAKLFSGHAGGEHKLTLNEHEKTLLCRECSSAIIQRNADDVSQISFLEPLDGASRAHSLADAADANAAANSDNNNNSNNSENDGTEHVAGGVSALGAAINAADNGTADKQEEEQQPRLTPKSLASLQNPITSAASVIQRLAGDFKFLNTQADLSQLTSLLEQHKTLNEFLAQQQQRLACPEHADSPNLADVDCKSCEFLSISQMSPLRSASKSPLKGYAHESNASSKTSSPVAGAGAGGASLTPNSQQQLALQHSMGQQQQQQTGINTSPSMSNSFTIGACPDHMNGRPIGVECARCEILLNSARLNSGQQISTRNSCKTLKCPQCNWHYKYQETLEIHMREKHPDGESACHFCLAGAAHPRLARGESYTCGYKPYRCEICNYSTTTKGNLSIHMQSDKHLNNVQELNNSQNMGVSQAPEIRSTPQPSQPPSIPSAPSTPQLPPAASKPKPKPSFRCEPCSYETPNARNYRIHETSEKHTHNLAVVQCNIKRLQSHMESFLKQQPPVGLPGLEPGNAGHLPGAALADLAYNQALLIQLLHQNNAPAGFLPSLLQQQQQQQQSGHFPLQAQQAVPSQQQQQQLNGTSSQELDQGLNPDTLEPPFEQDFNATYHFSCLICSNFNTNDLDELNGHINEDRSRLSFPQEFIVVVNNNNYTCRLCCYKTHLKANCQLHCKTDKHLQRVNFANHIKQGGHRNEYKFDYVINSTTNNNNYNITQLKCNCCDYYTNSIQKLNCHTQNVRHESMKAKFNHLLQLFKDVKLEMLDGQDVNISKALLCQLCNFKSNNLLDMVKHNKSLRHIQIEQIYCLQRRCESLESIELGEIYQLVDDVNLESPHDFSRDEDQKPSPSSPPSLQHQQQQASHQSKEEQEEQASALAMLKMIPFEQLKALAASLPPHQLVFKCSECEHLAEAKHELEQHFEVCHAGTDCSAIALPSLSALMAADKKEPDVMTIEPDIDGVMINSSSRSSSAVSMLEGGEERSAMPAVASSVMCPLCQETFSERKSLEQHVMSAHSVNAEGLNRLLQLVDTSHWLSQPKNTSGSGGTGGGSSAGGDYECLVCSDTLKSMNDLLLHASDHQHFSISGASNQFCCLLRSCAQRFASESQVQQHFRSAHLNVVISERHVYKYRCPMCPLAFKTEEKLNAHFMYHTMRDATKCGVCGRNFRSTTSLQRHVEQAHGKAASDEEATHDETLSNDDDDCVSGSGGDPLPDAKRFKASAAANYSLEKYHDPNRPYKCEDCLESFTQANILAVHKNSVSHLHRVKKKQGETLSGSSTPALVPSPSQLASEFDRRSVDFDRKSIDFEMEINNSIEGNKRKLSSDNDYDSPKKRFKCDICKVAYAQGSTLDIHMRSVGHQAKANRIMQQQQQMQQGPSSTPTSSSVSNAQDLLAQPPASSNGNLSPKQLQGNSNSNSGNSSNQQMYKALLENFGFDIVKQFNDLNKMPPGTPSKSNGSDEKKPPPEESEALDFSAQHKNAAEELLVAAAAAAHQKSLAEEQQQQQQQQKFDPAMLAQRFMEQQFLAQFPQFAQSLQNLNTGAVPMNTIEMLNLMQFHHLMSLNFMNLAPPLIFGGAQQGGVLSPGGGGAVGSPASVLAPPKALSEVPVSPVASGTPTTAAALSLLAQQQQQQQSQAQQQACAANQKRARTRITDDQLKILRSHFDINNSPSEESIIEMSKKANLPQKVVKHWFRNTLFKERQRNKDSPYNFANPPSTTLNLEEYERTGQTKVVPLSETEKAANSMLSTLQQQQQKLQEEQQKLQEQQQKFLQQQQQQQQQQVQQQQQQQAFNLSASSLGPASFPDLRPVSQPSSTASNERDESFIKSEPLEEGEGGEKHAEGVEFEIERFRQQHAQQQQQLSFFNSYETKSESGSSDILSRPQTPNSLYNNLSEAIGQQMDSLPAGGNLLGGGVGGVGGVGGNMNQMGPPKKFQLNKIFDKSYESNSSSSNSSTSSGKRANRTRFTDYQIKVLQEFFENNSYPKDSDLEYLSKLLLLSPRVIVVWFQNARQKQRKIYENQPNTTNTSPFESDEKKAGCINYTCKKCNLIFQRYYELIRHQKNHCFKEENNKKSAKAQIAAAQIAQSLSSEDSNSSLEINHASNLLGNNLLHPTPKSQLAPSSSSTSTQNLPKLNLNHPANLLTSSSATTSNNIMQPLDFHQQSAAVAPVLPCRNPMLDSFGAEVPPPALRPNFERSTPTDSPMASQTSPFFMGATSAIDEPDDSGKTRLDDKMQEFLLQKFSNQDFDLLTKNYDTFLQYYRANCPSEQRMEEKHLSMDFLTQFYHLSEFKRKLNGGEFGEHELNTLSEDECADDVVALDDAPSSASATTAKDADLGGGKISKMGAVTAAGMHSNKRLRTTILPEQLNFLYECYQKESNPSRKQLEEIAKKVNLKKRVVQVWYQNSRARERKGQFRQNMQIINKKCPYCSAIFKVKSALESHLQTKHADKQMVNIDTLPELSFGQHQAEAFMNAAPLPPQATSPDFWTSTLMQQQQQPQSSTISQHTKRGELSESEISFTDSNNEELGEDDYEFDNFNDDSAHGDENGVSGGGGGGGGCGGGGDKEKSKRHRTHVNRVQKSILRKIFDDVKTPSMIDCENIGREIGLFKRVVQVWFQNARANYKKFHNLTANELKKLPDKNPSDCMYCSDYAPSPNKSYNSHVLSQSHIQNIHGYVMRNESHEAEEEGEEPTLRITEHELSLNAYTNCHQQPSQALMATGDTHWIN